MAKKKLYYVDIIDSTYFEETSEPDPDDKWDRANTYTSHSVEGFKLREKQGDLLIDFKPELGVTYHLLYATNSTGDSFGHDDGAHIEYFELYESHELDIAHKNLEILKKAEDFSVKLIGKNGKKYQTSIPWAGYFEHLETLEIIQVQLHE